MGSIECVQGQAKGLREQLVLCHGMTFLNLSFLLFAPLFYYSWTSFLSFAYFHTSDIRKAKPQRHSLDTDY